MSKTQARQLANLFMAITSAVSAGLSLEQKSYGAALTFALLAAIFTAWSVKQ